MKTNYGLLKIAIKIDRWLSTEIQSMALGRLDEAKRIKLLRELRQAIVKTERS